MSNLLLSKEFLNKYRSLAEAKEMLTAEKHRRSEALAAKATSSFENFVRFTTQEYGCGWFNLEVCRDLQSFFDAVKRKERPRYMLFAPPRHGKSLLVSQKFPAYCLGKNPDCEIIATSYSADRAAANSRDAAPTAVERAWRAVAAIDPKA